MSVHEWAPEAIAALRAEVASITTSLDQMVIQDPPDANDDDEWVF
jgi:hypothetical protein